MVSPLSASECTDWLAKQNTTEMPYGQVKLSELHYLRLSAICGDLLAQVLHQVLRGASAPTNQALFQIMDWASFATCPQPEPLTQLHALHMRTATVFSPCGLLFSPDEAELLIHCCCYVVDDGLSAYLYLPKLSLTILFWESELVEIWSPDSSACQSFSQLLCNLGARVLS
jgi:hypothetical protein